MTLDHGVKVRVLPGQLFFSRVNKNYFSIYVNAVEGRKYLAEIYKPQLGKVKTGKSSISFNKLEDVNLDRLREMIEHAGRLTTEKIE